MVTATLRKVGGSVMLALPPAFVEAMDAGVGSPVILELNGNVLSVTATKPKFVLADMIAKCDFTAPLSDEDKEWLDMPNVGMEMT